ncbi:pyridoxamine 5'-phosphate oxidase family protein [Kineosporia babensis]|uniref:Pyridoxamine 5'-phosphate oxidase family protein n=1 Tax=Kineosporia babensis TaxID=499548 RepID=A0A9X1NKC9_9ACTN|nr:pyridoxamine 5'-phosphate oxidase family protein [Kineosporia babensis]MCD5315758.1 pyridoxamine 5'-phosphate oxidase family protein [Kineosporia babensis]
MPKDEHQAGVAKVAEIIKDVRIAMLTTIDDDGHLVSRPMAVQQVEFDGDLWFVSDGDARKVHQIQHGARTNVSFASNGAWLSVAGDAEVRHDRQKLEELWNPVLEAWFPDGPDMAGIALVKIHADTAEYWDAPGSKVTTLISYVKARVKGERAEVGENEVVDL